MIQTSRPFRRAHKKVGKLLMLFLLLIDYQVIAVDYHVGSDQTLKSISKVPWATLQAGD